MSAATPFTSISSEALAAQEACFARAFSEKRLEIARPLYAPDVVYLSPTVRLYDWPQRIEGIERTLEFIALTIRRSENIAYEAVEQVPSPGGAFVRIHFDFDFGARRYRSSYVVIYRHRDGLIAQQELYYDPSGRLEQIRS